MTIQEKAKVASFFHQISPQILQLVTKKYRHSKIVAYKNEVFASSAYKEEYKNSLNFVTETDLEVEEVITTQIKKTFSSDRILAEENYAQTKVGKKGRFWAIDPICGTANFARELKAYVTNITLIKDGQAVASCIVDHAHGEYIWSVGEGKIFIGKKRVKISQKSSGVMVEVDLTALLRADQELKIKYSKFITNLITKTNYYLISQATSLTFAYVALGRVDAYITANTHLWDVAAANFLILQAGGVVTDISGKPWTIDSKSVLAALDEQVHQQLIKFLGY
ncbi:MAG: inositol monophosphatase family protein [Candidatus Daviesbacteria bacterium]|nr:inositol monophosphatase family protein [Candidatus Daviesbacteria bacterium]